MARKVQDAKITTKNARASLASDVAHWRELPGANAHVGYRAGKWLVRVYLGAGRYKQTAIGIADDAMPADGETVLDYRQAAKLASQVAGDLLATSATEAVATVRSACEVYQRIRDARAQEWQQRMDVVSTFTVTMRAHVYPYPLADIALHRVSVANLREWLESLPALKPTTIQRIVKDVKAALNHTGAIDRETIRTGLDLKKAARPVILSDDDDDNEPMILTDDEVRAILTAMREQGDDVYAMFALLAQTGMRPSQIARCKVADVDLEAGTINIPHSRKGASDSTRKELRALSAALVETLRPYTEGRARNDILLTIQKNVSEDFTTWTRAGPRVAWSNNDYRRPWQHACKAAGIDSGRFTPYALRHSSIARQLLAGVPAILVAKRHQTSVVIIERHYGRFLSDFAKEKAFEL